MLISTQYITPALLPSVSNLVKNFVNSLHINGVLNWSSASMHNLLIMIICIDIISDAKISYLICFEKDTIKIFTTMQSFIHGSYIICSDVKDIICSWSRDIKDVQSLCHTRYLPVFFHYPLPGALICTFNYSWTWYEILYYCVTFGNHEENFYGASCTVRFLSPSQLL